MLDVAASGPLVGTAVAAALTLAGFILSSIGATDVSIDSVSFSDSFLMAVASQAFLGDRLAQPVVEVSVGLWMGSPFLILSGLIVQVFIDKESW